MGIFDCPDPISYINEVKDEKLKLAVATVGISAAYSQYITLLYELGKSLDGKWAFGVFSQPLIKMAASLYKLLQQQNTEKLIYTSVPRELAADQKLLDSILCIREEQK